MAACYLALGAACAPSPAGHTAPPSLSADGGTMDKLDFAIVGASMPPLVDDVGDYPEDLVSRIWQGVEDELVHPNFAITTGDYVMAAADHTVSAEAQFTRYMQARAHFTGPVYPVMGEHECGRGDDLCSGTAATPLFHAFEHALLHPAGQSRPYYSLKLRGNDGSWDAKLLMVATHAWDAAQESWLRRALAEPSTYTFVVRHAPLGEGHTAADRLCDQLLQDASYTLLIAGHRHEVSHDLTHRQLIVGNGGAPLGDAGQYGYVVARQRSDGAMVLTAYDYDTHAMAERFAVRPDGSAAPL